MALASDQANKREAAFRAIYTALEYADEGHNLISDALTHPELSHDWHQASARLDTAFTPLNMALREANHARRRTTSLATENQGANFEVNFPPKSE